MFLLILPCGILSAIVYRAYIRRRAYVYIYTCVNNSNLMGLFSEVYRVRVLKL